jgi:hypothetical protein
MDEEVIVGINGDGVLGAGCCCLMVAVIFLVTLLATPLMAFLILIGLW